MFSFVENLDLLLPPPLIHNVSTISAANRIGVVALAAALFAAVDCRGDETRYSAMFFNGDRLRGAEIHDWQEATQEPRLDNRKLFDKSNPVRWVEDLSLPPSAPPSAFVEFANGDRLPGRVVEFHQGDESPYRRLPPHLLVEPTAAIDWPEAPRPLGVGVQARWLRRVAWQRREDDRYRPGMLFLLDGRQLEFRSLRWNRNAVRVLLEQETREVPFGQIAEIHFPRQDAWQAWFEQLAALTPECSATLFQMETSDGVRATASNERFFPVTRGGGNPEHWFHAVQPAWALEPLWLRHRTIRMRTYFQPHEVPLTLIEPLRSLQRASLGGAWNWRRDANVQNGPLASAQLRFGWGLGVHAHSELEFELHPAVQSFQTQYGLDQLAGRGGCVKAVLLTGTAKGTVLHQSEFVVGSEKVHDTGTLAIPTNAAGPGRLTLVADAAHDKRPAGADPLEIRDIFDWWQPLLMLDAGSVKAEVRRRAAASLPLLQEWTLLDSGKSPLVFNTLDQIDALSRQFRTEIAPAEAFLAFSRRLAVGKSDRFLLLNVCRLEKSGTGTRIQVRIDGRAAGLFDVPPRTVPGDAEPFLIPVEAYRGRTVLVELFQIAADRQSRLEWRGISLLESDPRTVSLFDDDPQFVRKLTDGEATAEFVTDDKYAGAGSVRLTLGERENPTIDGWNFAVRTNPDLGEFRYIRFAWKKPDGKKRALHLAGDGRFVPDRGRNERDSLRYSAGGSGKRDFGPSINVDRRNEREWEVVTRDLKGDFGEFNLTGMRLLCPDGETALFDHIYLARRLQDFDRLPAPGKNPPLDPVSRLPADIRANVDGIVTDPVRYGELVSEVAPIFSAGASESGVWLYKEYQGRRKVLRTHPPEQGRPCVLLTPLHVTANKQTELRLGVSHHTAGDWQLVVKAGGETLHDETISEKTTKAGWKDVTVDLSRFADRNIILEVHNQPTGWQYEFAYWSGIELRVK